MDDDGHFINDHIQMMGVCIRDDKEDLLMGQEELFGRSADTPIDLAIDGDGDVSVLSPTSRALEQRGTGHAPLTSGMTTRRTTRW